PPPLRITSADPNGTGVDTATLRLSLKTGSDPAVNVLPYVTVTPAEATGLVPSASPLTDGTYLLTAVIVDKAGNESTATSRFEVDTAPPTVEVETPAANGYVASATPRFSVRWTDALSGVDTDRVQIFLDGVDKTARFTMTPTGAAGVLLAGDALAEGQHAIRIVLFDRAGNAGAVLNQTFTVDTIVPTVQIDAPVNNGYVGPAPYHFAATFADASGSGIAPAWVVVTVDGTDRTAEFTI